MERITINELKENTACKISGFVEKLRDTKYMIFVILQDITGKIQVSIDKAEQEKLATEVIRAVPGSVVSFWGKMQLNEKVKQGGKEFIPKKLSIESIAETAPIDSESGIDQRRDYRCWYLRQ